MNNLKVIFTTEQDPILLDMMSEEAKNNWGIDLLSIENFDEVKVITYPNGSPKDFIKNVLPAFIGAVNTANKVRKTNVEVVESKVDTYVKASFGGEKITKDVFFGDEYLKDYGLIKLDQTSKDLKPEVKAWWEKVWNAKVAFEDLLSKENSYLGKGAKGGTHIHKIPSRVTKRS